MSAKKQPHNVSIPGTRGWQSNILTTQQQRLKPPFAHNLCNNFFSEGEKLRPLKNEELKCEKITQEVTKSSKT